MQNLGRRFTNFAQAGEDVGEVHNGIPNFIDLMEYKVTEQFDDVPVTSFGPSRLAGEPILCH